jgi:DNA-binding NarL/FixJ family response regulator
MLQVRDETSVTNQRRGDMVQEEIIRVLLVDDHQVIREGMKRILATDKKITVVGEASNGLQAIEMARLLTPDIITMDVRMPGMDGIAATREIKKFLPDVIIIILTLFAENHVKEAMEAGASGYVLKDSDATVIIDSIHQSVAGYYPISPSITKEMLSQFAQLLKNNREQLLTERQVEILKLVSEGLSAKEIAARICVSSSTAKREIHEIVARLQAADRAQAVSMAIHQRII